MPNHRIEPTGAGRSGHLQAGTPLRAGKARLRLAGDRGSDGSLTCGGSLICGFEWI